MSGVRYSPNVVEVGDDGLKRLRTSATGTFSFSGLSEALKITNTTIGDTATAIPLTALTNRNSMIIFNKSTTLSLFIGNSDVTDSGTDEGWIIDPESYFSLDVANEIVIYGLAPSGETVDVKILEFA